jgi:cell division protein FtsQ
MKFKIHRRYLILLIGVIIFSATSYILGWSNLVTVKEIVITGTPSNETRANIIRSVEIEVGDPLARVDPRSLSQRLTAMGWIDSTEISRDWLKGKVRIAVKPRTAVALYSIPGGPQVALDASGIKFVPVVRPPSGLPNVVATSVENGLAAIKVFTDLPPAFSAGINKMSAARMGSFELFGKFYGRELRIVWGDWQETSLKVKVISALLERQENSRIKFIDVSAPHAPIVK